MAPNQLLQHKALFSQPQLQPQAKPQPLAQHQQPSAGRRSHRTLPKDQTQLLSLQHDHRHRERERQRQREKSVAAVQKLTANSGNTAAAAAAAVAVAASSPSRPTNSQRSAVKSCLPQLSRTLYHLDNPHLSVCLALSLALNSVEVRTLSLSLMIHFCYFFLTSESFFLCFWFVTSSLSWLTDLFHLKVKKVLRKEAKCLIEVR